jgi:prepilin-type N-terminal cleavage/methylation domain-containing protein
MFFMPLPLTPHRSARCLHNRGGFTLVEILVVIAIIALLAGVALPAVTGALKKAKENAAMQTAHGLGLALFQYANDNSQIYPGNTTGANAVTLASSNDAFKLLVPSYISNTDALFIAGAGGSKNNVSTSTTTFTLAAGTVSWDLTVHQAGDGLTTNDPDQTPVVFSTGATNVSYGNANADAPVTASITGNLNPFGKDGVAVGYKDMSSAFMSSSNNGGTAASFDISSTSFNPGTETYKQLPAVPAGT